MFYQSIFDGDISKWRPSLLKTASYMFAHSQFNGDISRWCPSSLRESHFMFQGARFQGNLSHWTLSNLTTDNRYRMFPSQFEGILPRMGTTYQERRELYRSVHGGSKGLTAYLESHAFNAMHLDIAMNSKRRPHGIEPIDWVWAQKIRSAGLALGLDDATLGVYALEQYGLRGSAPEEPLNDVDFSLLLAP